MSNALEFVGVTYLHLGNFKLEGYVFHLMLVFPYFVHKLAPISLELFQVEQAVHAQSEVAHGH